MRFVYAIVVLGMTLRAYSLPKWIIKLTGPNLPLPILTPGSLNVNSFYSGAFLSPPLLVSALSFCEVLGIFEGLS